MTDKIEVPNEVWERLLKDQIGVLNLAKEYCFIQDDDPKDLSQNDLIEIIEDHEYLTPERYVFAVTVLMTGFLDNVSQGHPNELIDNLNGAFQEELDRIASDDEEISDNAAIYTAD